MLVNTFLASLAAKLAMATGLAVATVTAAGAAGVLPDPAQRAVASVVEAATPLDLPGTSEVDEVVGGVTDDVTTPTTLPTTPTIPGTDVDDDGEDGDGATDATRKANHGACVSTAAKNTSGPDKGKTVSSVARSDCGKKSETTTPTTVAPTTSSTSTTVAGGSTTTSSTVATVPTSSNSSKGNSGKGNSGKN